MNRAIFVLLMLAGLFSAGLLSGCQPAGKVYAIAPKEAAAMLTGSTIPAMLLGTQFRSDPAYRAGDDVIWSLRKDDGPDAQSSDGASFRLIVHLSPAGQGTRIVADVAPDGRVTPEQFATRSAKVPQIIGLLNAITAEQVDSTLNHRNFNVAAINSQLMEAMITMLPALREQMRQKARADRSDAPGTTDHAAYQPGSTERDDTPTRIGQGRAIQAEDDTRPVDDTRPDNESAQ